MGDGSAPTVWQSAVPDVLAPGLRVVFCGINPGRVSAEAGAHFANPRNDFWRLLHAAGFTSRLYEPHEQFDVLAEGIGITNAAYRTTPGSGDLRRGDFAGSAERLEQLALELEPAWIGFVGKEAYRGAFNERPELGVQERRLGQTRLFVLPSTSPANAAVPWAERERRPVVWIDLEPEDDEPESLESRLETIADRSGELAIVDDVQVLRSRAALATLSDVQRETLELAYFSGLTQVEIAERTGVPLGTVKGRVRLALVALRRALEPSGAGGPP